MRIGRLACYLCFFICMVMIFVDGNWIFGAGAALFALVLVYYYNKKDVKVATGEEVEE